MLIKIPIVSVSEKYYSEYKNQLQNYIYVIYIYIK